MSPRVTQKDIARAAGVSHAAVSLALRDHHSIPKPTRERIKELAQKMGYVPDPMLAGLAAYRMSRRPAAYKSNIAWVADCAVYEEGSDSVIGTAAKAKQYGYNLELISMNELEHSASRLEKVLDAKGITGLILSPCARCGTELRLDFSRFSAVRLGYSYHYPILHTIVNNQFKTTYTAFNKAVAAGYKRVGIILTPELDLRTGQNFLGGFRAAQQAIPIEQRTEPLYLICPNGVITASNAGREVSRWINENHIDVVVANGQWHLIHDILGFEVGYIELDRFRGEPFISGLDQNNGRIGITALEHLISMMNRGETGIPEEPTVICVPSRWMDGQTLPPKT